MTLTPKMLQDGEMAVRKMSEEAQTAYNETDPFRVYKTGEDSFTVKGCLGYYDGLTFSELESMLEEEYLANHGVEAEDQPWDYEV